MKQKLNFKPIKDEFKDVLDVVSKLVVQRNTGMYYYTVDDKSKMDMSSKYDNILNSVGLNIQSIEMDSGSIIVTFLDGTKVEYVKNIVM